MQASAHQQAGRAGQRQPQHTDKQTHTYTLEHAPTGLRAPAGRASRPYTARQGLPFVHRGELQERPAGANVS
eukprot:scaffold10007_cov24-Tisochrysis_lutea.AAC.1